MPETDINVLLNGLYTDFLMLRSGEWVPDHDSVDASIEALEQIAEILHCGLEDQRYV